MVPDAQTVRLCQRCFENKSAPLGWVHFDLELHQHSGSCSGLSQVRKCVHQMSWNEELFMANSFCFKCNVTKLKNIFIAT